jgi:site-specific recombinase XerD
MNGTYAMLLMRVSAHIMSADKPRTNREFGVAFRGVDEEREWIRDFIRDQKHKRLSPRLVRSRESVLELVLSKLGSFDVGDKRLRQWIDTWPKYHEEPTKEGVRIHLAIFYDWCNSHDLINGNPARKFKFETSKKRARASITDEEVRRALNLASGQERCWIALSAYQGLAFWQMERLSAQDIDMSASPVALRLIGKGSKAISPNLHPETLAALRQLPTPARDRLFPGLSAQDISKVLGKYLIRQGIRVNPYALVHWYRKQAALFGIDFGRRFDETVIDPELWEHVRRSFATGDWESVISRAAKFTEDRIRRWTGRPRGEVGKDLMTAVFADHGAFRLGSTDAEMSGWHLFAMGLTLAVRNPAAHHVEERADHRAYAAGFLGACSLLLIQFRHDHSDKTD